MNFNARKLRINPCVLCTYPFSDNHHVYPQAWGDKKSATVALCPNHHRYANIVQAMIQHGNPIAEIRKIAGSLFDTQFNEQLLDILINIAITGEVDQVLL